MVYSRILEMTGVLELGSLPSNCSSETKWEPPAHRHPPVVLYLKCWWWTLWGRFTKVHKQKDGYIIGTGVYESMCIRIHLYQCRYKRINQDGQDDCNTPPNFHDISIHFTITTATCKFCTSFLWIPGARWNPSDMGWSAAASLWSPAAWLVLHVNAQAPQDEVHLSQGLLLGDCSAQSKR